MNYKEGKCLDCKKTSKLISKRCQYCYWKYRSSLKKKNTEDKLKKKNLDIYFAEQTLVFSPICENCGSKLDTSSKFAMRSQTCHIIEKSKFPSVATHPQNKIFMCCFGGCYGHSKYDNGDAKTRQSMQVYEIAIERFRSLENSLTTSEKMKAYKYLGLDQNELL